MEQSTIFPVFPDPINQNQVTFRTLLKLMSEPGTILPVADAAICPDVPDDYRGMWSIAQVLLDSDCSFAVLPSLDNPSFSPSLSFHTDAHKESTEIANFVFMKLDDLHEISQFNSGSLESPHQSATVIVQVSGVSNEPQMMLNGPGIKGEKPLTIDSILPNQIQLIQDNHGVYPCGLDFIFCTATHCVAIPRSTQIKIRVEAA